MDTLTTQSELARTPKHHTLVLGALGAYVNAVAWGFLYGEGNHEFDLALVNWLRDPSLYPNDPIREAFARFPTVFWPGVAYLSRWMSTEKVLLVFFLLTKVLFFVALARLVSRVIEDRRLAACIVVSVALSPFLNDLTPLGMSDVLSSIQTHTSLAIALLLWACNFLLERRWLVAAALCALTIYLDALFFLYMLFAFATFAALDWRQRKAEVVLAGLLGAAIALPWPILSEGVVYRPFPKGYVEALLAFFPMHLRLRSHEPYELVCGAGLVVAAALMVMVARKAGLRRDPLLELLAASFLVPVSLGALLGESFLPPTLARLQLLRADSFLVLYSVLLIEIYGANLLLSSPGRRAGTTFFLGTMALLLPLSDLLGLLWPLLIGMLLWASPWERFESFCRFMARSRGVRAAALLVLLAGITLAGLPRANWSSSVVILLTVIGGCFFAYQGSPILSARMSKLAAAVSGLAFVMMAAGTLPRLSSLWWPVVPPGPLEADWHQVQQWARSNTPRDAQFLVPTYPGGFREFSERSSWGEWKDGQAMYHYPPLADVYRQRMQAVSYPWPSPWIRTEGIQANYKRLSWERVLAIARENHLSYIIQFQDVPYPVVPVTANDHYAVYKAVP